MEFDWPDFARSLPREERIVSERLRQLILEADPKLVEKYNYWVPYYVRNKMVCFIWPVSAPNAPKAKNQKDGGTIVSLGFCYGNKLSNDQGLLLAEGRKQVYIIRFTSIQDVDKLEDSIREILAEAILVDDLAKKAKRSRSK